MLPCTDARLHLGFHQQIPSVLRISLLHHLERAILSTDCPTTVLNDLPRRAWKVPLNSGVTRLRSAGEG